MAEKKFVIDNPTLAAEWNYEKNGNLHPEKMLLGSHKKAWWKCDKGHEWEAVIKSRNIGRGCPVCAGRIALKGYNDLATLNPKLAAEWNFEKNEELKPDQFTIGSHQKVWWKCEKGHEWEAEIKNRNAGRGCPVCAGRIALKGYNDLATLNPKVAVEWNYEMNNGLTPADVLPNSNKKVWWQCEKGHEWEAAIASRNAGCGCPVCSSERKTSFPEFALVFYLKQCGEEVRHSFRDFGYELDVFLPQRKIAVEYDGFLWHGKKMKQDLSKNRKCEQDGIKLFRIREGLPSLNDSSRDFVIQENQKDLPEAIETILCEILGKNVDVDLKRDTIAIENLREFMGKENSLLAANPKLAAEWNFEKNGKLKPEHFFANSNKSVWWKCEKGHEWQAMINHRRCGSGCPICSGRKVLRGYNDLATKNPKLAAEWNYEKNGALKPEQFTANSNKKVWWKCEKGHEWEAIISHRNRGSSCPICSGHQVLQGYNDLGTKNPTLAKEWNYEKNNGLRPEDVTVGSDKKVWWKCEKGHEWEAAIASRNAGCGCPICANKKALQGYNDLATVNPKLAAEWNHEKNGELKPEQFTANSGKKVWWKCEKGHEWEAKIDNRNNGSGCPICAREKRSKRGR